MMFFEYLLSVSNSIQRQNHEIQLKMNTGLMLKLATIIYVVYVLSFPSIFNVSAHNREKYLKIERLIINYLKNYTNTLMSLLSQCIECQNFIFQSFRACPNPKTSAIWVYFSLLPFLISFLYLVIFSLSRKMKYLNVFAMMHLVSILCDNLFLLIFTGTNPQDSCKLSYGMPSSLMVSFAQFIMQRLKYSRCFWQKISWIVSLILVGISRVELNYHSPIQILIGALIGIPLFVIFDKIWTLCVPILPEERMVEDSTDLNEQIVQRGRMMERNNQEARNASQN